MESSLLNIITLGVISSIFYREKLHCRRRKPFNSAGEDDNTSSGSSSSESEDGDGEGDENDKDINLEDAAPLFGGELLAQNELESNGTNFDVAPLPVNRIRTRGGVPRRRGVRIRSGKRRRMSMGANPS